MSLSAATGDPSSGPSFVADIRPQAAEIAALCDAADAHVAARGVGGRGRYALRLVLEELLTNIAKYAGAPGAVGVRVETVSGTIRVRVDDDGAAFDPTTGVDSPAPTSLDAARVGGLGLRMVRASARSLRYRREGGRNIVEADIDLASRS